MKPAEASPNELILLKALWRMKRASARELHDAVGVKRGWSYSTTRTVLQRMVEKGAARRGEVHGLIVFEPGMEKVETIGRMLRDFAGRVMEVDGALPVSAFAGSALLDEDELAELERLLGDDSDPEASS
ncbi:MAG: BlaI/MecI/CopY family transcriptional regulator [Pseudomonadota bacterium]